MVMVRRYPMTLLTEEAEPVEFHGIDGMDSIDGIHPERLGTDVSKDVG